MFTFLLSHTTAHCQSEALFIRKSLAALDLGERGGRGKEREREEERGEGERERGREREGREGGRN